MGVSGAGVHLSRGFGSQGRCTVEVNDPWSELTCTIGPARHCRALVMLDNCFYSRAGGFDCKKGVILAYELKNRVAQHIREYTTQPIIDHYPQILKNIGQCGPVVLSIYHLPRRHLQTLAKTPYMRNTQYNPTRNHNDKKFL
jgi:hypothetical protein